MNSLIRHTMDNHALAKHWYWSLMNNNSIPMVGKVEGLPESEEERMDTIALFVVIACEGIATGSEEITASVDELIEAQQLFKILMSVEKQSELGFCGIDWNNLDENGMPAITMCSDNIKAQAKYFEVEFDENNLEQTVNAIMEQADTPQTDCNANQHAQRVECVDCVNQTDCPWK